MPFPDGLGLVVAYLDAQNSGIDVVTRVPVPCPERLIQVRRAGGTAGLVRDRPRLDVFAWAPTDLEAMALALTVRAQIWALAGKTTLGPMCYRVEETMGPRQFDDQISQTPRVWATYALDIRADAAIHIAP
jgi:hypothetical protein